MIPITTYIFWGFSALLLVAVKIKNAAFLYYTLLAASIFMFLSGFVMAFMTDNLFSVFAYGFACLLGAWITCNIVYEKAVLKRETAKLDATLGRLEKLNKEYKQKKLEELFWHHRN